MELGIAMFVLAFGGMVLEGLEEGWVLVEAFKKHACQ